MRWNSQSISWPYVETFSGSHQFSMRFSRPPVRPRDRPALLLHHLDADLGRLASLDVDVLGLLAELLVPDLDGLLAGRDPLELRDPVLVRHAEVRRRHHREPPEHPAVDVTRQLDDLRLLELLGHRLLELGLRLVDGRVRSRVRV